MVRRQRQYPFENVPEGESEQIAAICRSDEEDFGHEVHSTRQAGFAASAP